MGLGSRRSIVTTELKSYNKLRDFLHEQISTFNNIDISSNFSLLAEESNPITESFECKSIQESCVHYF